MISSPPVSARSIHCCQDTQKYVELGIVCMICIVCIIWNAFIYVLTLTGRISCQGEGLTLLWGPYQRLHTSRTQCLASLNLRPIRDCILAYLSDKFKQFGQFCFFPRFVAALNAFGSANLLDTHFKVCQLFWLGLVDLIWFGWMNIPTVNNSRSVHKVLSKKKLSIGILLSQEFSDQLQTNEWLVMAIANRETLNYWTIPSPLASSSFSSSSSSSSSSSLASMRTSIIGQSHPHHCGHICTHNFHIWVLSFEQPNCF